MPRNEYVTYVAGNPHAVAFIDRNDENVEVSCSQLASKRTPDAVSAARYHLQIICLNKKVFMQ